MNEKEIKGWGDIQIDLNAPLGMVIDMINILNQRLVTVENISKTEGGLTLTEMYQKQAEEELAKRQAKEKETVDLQEQTEKAHNEAYNAE